MNPLADDLIVALLLAVSVGYAAMKLGPRSLRQRIQAAAANALSKTPTLFGLAGIARRLTVRSLQKSTGACGGCDNCGTESPAPGQKAGDSGEVSVPVTKIGRRVVEPTNR